MVRSRLCWLVELGNADKFIFDIGTGSAERLSAMKIPYDFLDKVFIGHLHSDHIGRNKGGEKQRWEKQRCQESLLVSVG